MTISYLEAREAPLLEWEKERLLIQQWQQFGSKTALQELMMSHARMVHTLARRLARSPNDHEELIAEGLLGLIKAANMFELKRNLRFSTYARWWVKNGLTSAVNRLYSVVDMPAQAHAGHAPALNTDPTRALQPDIDSEGMEAFESPDPTPEEHAIVQSSRALMRKCILDAMQTLGAVEREIVVSRSLRMQPASMEDLSQRLGLSRDRLRQVERRALSKMKYELLSRGISSAQAGYV